MKGFTHESTHNESQEWYTPPEIFELLRFPTFDLDPASPGKDVVPWVPAEKHLTILDDGLSAQWQGSVWLNPPYGDNTFYWLRRLRRHGNGIALVFSRTDTVWFHTEAIKADALCFLVGRIKFVKGGEKCLDGSADFRRLGTPGCGSLLLAHGKECAKILLESGAGWCVDNRNNKVPL